MKISFIHGLWLFAVALIAFILSKVALAYSGLSIWDDAYIFIRYADNILTSGSLSFNPGGDKTYGITSLAYLGVVLPFRMLFPDYPAMTMIIASSVCGFFFIGILIVLLKNCVASKNDQVRWSVVVLVLFSISYTIKSFSTHFVSGMDTMFVLAFFTGYILISKWHEHTLSRLSAFLTGCAGGLAFAVRPDLMIYTVILPVTSIFYSSNRKARRTAMSILMVTGIITLLQVIIYTRYLNSPFPLSFYVKGLRLYGKAIYDQYRFIPWKELYQFVLSLPLLFSAIVIPFILDPKIWWMKMPSTDKGLLFATIVFISYYLLFVLQIMHFSQRFYYPTLPALAFLAAQSIVFIYEKLSFSGVFNVSSVQAFLKAVLISSLIFSMFPTGYFITKEALVLFRGRIKELHNFDIVSNYKKRWRNYWFCLEQFSNLPDDFSIATTEIGVPLAMNPKKVIVDLTGLNETMIAHDGFSADKFFQKYQPDLIYMPHPHYQDIIRQIRESPYFSYHYEYFSSSDISAFMGIALKKDSKYYARLREIVKSNCPGTS